MIKSVKIKHFRNHTSYQLDINKPFVYLFGENGAGKTSILESIYFCSTTKSHRTSDEKECIQKNQPFAQVVIKTDDDTYEIVLTKNGKRAKINQVEKRKLSAFVGHLNVVMFAPGDLELIKGAPSVRRQFVDFELLQIDASYLNDLKTYKQILKQRNTLLKKLTPQDDFTFLNILGEQLYDVGVNLIKKRRVFIEILNQLMIKHYQSFSHNKIKLVYKPHVDEIQFKKYLENQQKQDILYQTTNAGPHRDDLFFSFNDFDAKNYASQGETRLIVIALKLALLEWIEMKTKRKTVLLLDDVLSELDETTQQIFLKVLPKHNQIIMNSVHKINLEHIQMVEITKENKDVKL